MNNALEDILETYLRHVENCKLVERNVFIPGGEIDAIGIDPEKKRIVICEATAASEAYGSACATRVAEKFERARRYAEAVHSWVGCPRIEGQFWAPSITEAQTTAVRALSVLSGKIVVVDAYRYFQFVAALKVKLPAIDPKALNPTCQLMRLELELKRKMKNRLEHKKREKAKQVGGQGPLPPAS